MSGFLKEKKKKRMIFGVYFNGYSCVFYGDIILHENKYSILENRSTSGAGNRIVFIELQDYGNTIRISGQCIEENSILVSS